MSVDDFIRVYEYLYRKTVNSNFDFQLTEKNLKQIQKFLIGFGEDLSLSSLFDYLLFQFYRYKESIVLNGSIQLNWIIGSKSLLKWKEKSVGYTFYVDKWKREKKVRNIFKENKLKLSDSYKIYLRKINSKTELGFIDCKERKLFDNDCIVCINCKFLNYCVKF